MNFLTTFAQSPWSPKLVYFYFSRFIFTSKIKKKKKIVFVKPFTFKNLIAKIKMLCHKKILTPKF